MPEKKISPPTLAKPVVKRQKAGLIRAYCDYVVDGDTIEVVLQNGSKGWWASMPQR